MDDFQQELTKIPGVRTARVVGEQAPTEIHIVATGARSAKQLVRDVQSLATAGFGLQIDHRIVSVVQIEDNGHNPDLDSVQQRAVIEWVKMASRGQTGHIDVGLKLAAGEAVGGADAPSSTRDARARAAAEAVVQALKPVLDERNASVEVDTVILQKIGSDDSVLIKAVFRDQSSLTPLLGSAIIQDDVVTATARALLHALNRKLH
jgi:hypothetical protein